MLANHKLLAMVSLFLLIGATDQLVALIVTMVTWVLSLNQPGSKVLNRTVSQPLFL